MARAPWEPREGETEEERETRLAADDVHRRLEQARLRELEEAYWRSRATSSAPDADSAKRNVVGARSATPRATLAGVRDAAPSTRARASTRGDGGGGLISDLEVQELARAASRVGATPDVSRRVAEEVLAAERVAVDAAMRRASARRSSARAASSLFPRASTPRTRPVAFDTPADAETATKASRSAAAASRRDPRGGDGDGDDDDGDDGDDDVSAGMTSALWDMARTPGPERPRGDETRVSRKTSFFSPRLGDEIEIDAVAAAAASRARGLFGGGDPLSSRRARAAFSQAAAAAVEDGLRKLVARTNESPKKGGAVAAMAANARLNAHTSVVSPTTLSSRSRVSPANASAPSEATRRERSPSSPSSASVAEEGDEGDEREREEKAWLSEAAFAREDGDDDASADETRDEDENENESRALWLEEDLRAVRAAHAAARRAEDAAARLEADECAARLATTAAVARLLDARVALAAATARAVSEEAATTAASCAAEAASLRLTLDDEVGPSGDRGVGTCEALAEALSAPLSLPKISSNVRGGKRRS
jgi:hypothetical protein